MHQGYECIQAPGQQEEHLTIRKMKTTKLVQHARFIEMNAIQHSKETQRKRECKNTNNFVLSEASRAYDKINSLSNDEGNAMQGIRHMKKRL